MLCEKCKKNEAKINLVKIINGEKQQIWLCEECAKNISNIPFLSSIPDGAGFPFQEVINGLLTGLENSAPKKDVEKKVCPVCGLTLEQLKKTKKVGCSNCYIVFKEPIKAIIKNVTKEGKHVGRIPNRTQREFIQRDRLKNLKHKLQILIEKEEYEEAAIVRDEIRQIELYIIKSNVKDDEKYEEENCNEELDS